MSIDGILTDQARMEDRAKKLEAIRAVCIKANPDKDWEYDIYRSENGTNGEKTFDAVRLADVLLAIGATLVDIHPIYFVSESGMFWKEDWKSDKSAVETTSLPAQWNLRTDDLTAQSDECIDFIHSLLV